MGEELRIIRFENHWLERVDDKYFACVPTRKHGKKIIVRIPLEESLEKIRKAS